MSEQTKLSKSRPTTDKLPPVLKTGLATITHNNFKPQSNKVTKFNLEPVQIN